MPRARNIHNATRQSDATNEVVDFIVKTVKERSRKLITHDTAKHIYRGIIDLAMQRVVENGFFKLPWGYGQFYVVIIGQNAKPRRMPDGTVVQRKPRAVVKYTEGEIVKALLGTGAKKRNSSDAPVK